MTGPKVIQVFVSDMVGGTEIVNERLMAGLRGRVDWLVACPPGEFSRRMGAGGFRVLEVPGLERLHRERDPRPLPIQLARFLHLWARATAGIAALVIRERPRCVQVNNANAGARLLPAVLLCRTLLRPFTGKVRWVLLNHNLRYTFAKDRAFDSLCALLFHRVAVVCGPARAFYPAALQAKVEVIHNGLNLAGWRFRPEARREFREAQGIDEGRVAIGIIGRISEAKGQALLLDSLDRLEPSLRDRVTLFVVGEAMPEAEPYRRSLSDYLERRPWGKRVIFLGHRCDVDALLSGLDVVVNASSASVGEALPLSLVEAMACGRLVIAPRMGGIPEIVDDGADGFLYPPDDADGLARALARVIGPAESLEPLRAAARRKAEERFTLERMLERYLDLYEIGAAP